MWGQREGPSRPHCMLGYGLRGTVACPSSAACLGAGGAQPPSARAALQARLAAWVAWLLGGLAVPLLRASFYVTESEAYRQQVFYYR